MIPHDMPDTRFRVSGNCPLVEQQLDGRLFEKTAVATKPKPQPLGCGCYHPRATVGGWQKRKRIPFRSSATQTGFRKCIRYEKKGKSSLSSGQSIKPTAFFLRSWEHEDLVLFLEPVGEIKEFGLLGDEGGLPIGGLRELRLEIRDLVIE